MEPILTMIANFGFPIIVAAYLLVRVEGKLEKLTAAIGDLAKVGGELMGSASRPPRAGPSADSLRWGCASPRSFKWNDQLPRLSIGGTIYSYSNRWVAEKRTWPQDDSIWGVPRCVGRKSQRTFHDAICRKLQTKYDILYHVLMATIHGEQQILTIIKSKGIVRPADLKALGLPRIALYRLLEKGLVQRESRGLYVATGHRVTENHTIAQVCARVPNAVICLLTALRFHDLTTQQPPEVWIALPSKARRPNLEYPRLRVARFSGMALTEGIESYAIEAVQVHIYSAAKTVADCFKYRNKVGIDVAVEALRDFTRRYRGNQDLARFARICRVQRVMQPYLEAIP